MYLIEQDLFEQFENAASYSFIEHSGLGRYGEALSANGDIEMLRMIQCLLKPGGLMFLGVQTSKDNTSYIEYNYHRVYGQSRISRLIDRGWTIKSQKREDHNLHTLFTLVKTENSCDLIEK